MSNVAIALKNISKCYRLYRRPSDRLKELLIPGKLRAREFWALRNISLEVKEGETLGIVGQNGSGKSTLLQIIAGTLTPSEGEVTVNGRVAALLELGSGFNPEFTGRQNVFFNGQILGLAREEVEAKFDAIAAFADIGEFIDQPVKTYSSGMAVRLAFAVVAHTEPRILIVDEALAVGDAKFQVRCMQRIRQMKEQGVTILFVSHDASSVKMLCDQAILLHHGEAIRSGQPREVVNYYIELLNSGSTQPAADVSETATSPEELASIRRTTATQSADEVDLKARRYGTKLAVFREIKITDAHGQEAEKLETGSTFHISISLEAMAELSDLVVGISIRNLMGVVMYGTNTYHLDSKLPSLEAGQTITLTFQLPCQLNRGVYTVTVGAHSEGGLSYDWVDELVVFEVYNTSQCEGFVDLASEVRYEVLSSALPS